MDAVLNIVDEVVDKMHVAAAVAHEKKVLKAKPAAPKSAPKSKPAASKSKPAAPKKTATATKKTAKK